MFYCEKIPSLVCDELVKVHKTVEENTNLSLISFQLSQVEVPLYRLWLYHVIHLAQQVNEENWLMIQVFKSMHLFFVKVVHFMRCDCPIFV